jgi:hypothetical protein
MGGDSGSVSHSQTDENCRIGLEYMSKENKQTEIDAMSAPSQKRLSPMAREVGVPS